MAMTLKPGRSSPGAGEDPLGRVISTRRSLDGAARSPYARAPDALARHVLAVPRGRVSTGLR
ncbi:MAG TPA: hypothetical protein VHA54_05375 [Solirubrobacterales bacterium]|nr:hypothetical protein [Solirubrobacterales bacterium]